MNGVDSPMEAVVNLGPLLTAAINNLWAWLAVVTAAFSFWRLRSTTTTTTTTPPPPPLDHEPPPQTTPSSISPKTPTITKTTSFEKSGEEEGVLTRGNSSKELFTVCYEKEERENDDCDGDGDEMEGGDELVVRRWGMGLTVEMRGTGDLGWYKYQDRGVIGGNVVKLWDEERENCSPSRSCSPGSSCRRRSPVLASAPFSPLVFT